MKECQIHVTGKQKVTQLVEFKVQGAQGGQQRDGINKKKCMYEYKHIHLKMGDKIYCFVFQDRQDISTEKVFGTKIGDISSISEIGVV